MARAGWERLDRLTLQAAYIDNNGDRQLYDGEYSWDTRFWLLGAKLNLGHGLALLGEAMLGNTLMGNEVPQYDDQETDPYGGQSPYPYTYPDPYPEQQAPEAAWVDMDFATGYVLLSWQRSQLRVSLRYDRFENSDNDGTAEDDSEDGRAFTMALFWTPNEHLRLGAEYVDLRSERYAAAQSGADPDTDAWKGTLEARVSF
jgi:hypothetical protein